MKLAIIIIKQDEKNGTSQYGIQHYGDENFSGTELKNYLKKLMKDLDEYYTFHDDMPVAR